MVVISYSRKNKDFVMPMVSLLKAAGTKVFVDVQNFNYGEDWEEQISTAISKAEKLLIFWSRHSTVSEPITKEWNLCLDAPNCKIVPVLLDNTPLPKEIERFHGTNEFKPLIQKISRAKLYSKTFRVSIVILAVVILFGLSWGVMMYPTLTPDTGIPGPNESIDRFNPLPIGIVLLIVIIFLIQFLFKRRVNNKYKDLVGLLMS